MVTLLGFAFWVTSRSAGKLLNRHLLLSPDEQSLAVVLEEPVLALQGILAHNCGLNGSLACLFVESSNLRISPLDLLVKLSQVFLIIGLLAL